VALANRLLPAPRGGRTRRAGRCGATAGSRYTRCLNVVEATLAQVRAALDLDGSIGGDRRGRRPRPRVAAALAAAGHRRWRGPREEEQQVTVLPASLAKGLEYDHVDRRGAGGDRVGRSRGGLNRLYVVLTRAVCRAWPWCTPSPSPRPLT